MTRLEFHTNYWEYVDAIRTSILLVMKDNELSEDQIKEILADFISGEAPLDC